jgi:hypothetical protein
VLCVLSIFFIGGGPELEKKNKPGRYAICWEKNTCFLLLGLLCGLAVYGSARLS